MRRQQRLQFSLLCILFGMAFAIHGESGALSAADFATAEGVALRADAASPADAVKAAEAEGGNREEEETPSLDSDELGPLDTTRFKPSVREIPFAGAEGKVVLLVSIQGPIDLGIAPYLERVLAGAAERDDVVALISEIDTPGGRVDAAGQIKDAFLNAKIPTVAWVHSQAISAGALIAFSHDFILFSTGGTMGAATPIQLGAGGDAQPVGEKVVSYMRSIMRATAEAKGRDGDVAEAMVDADFRVSGVSRKGKLLTLTDKQALEIGVGDGAADSLESVLEFMHLQDATIERPQSNWAEEVARVLTGPTLSSLLMALGMLGIFFELSSPGFGFPGILGISSLLLFFLGHSVVHLAGAEEMALLGVGLLLVGAEIFVIPGLGIAGLLGVFCVFISLVLMLIAMPLEVSWEMGDLSSAIQRVGISMALTLAGIIGFFRFLPESSAGRWLVLRDTLGGDSVIPISSPEETERDVEVGATGVVERDLRPVGKARIGGALFDVVSQGDYLEVGDAVRVIAVEGSRVVVASDSGRGEVG